MINLLEGIQVFACFYLVYQLSWFINSDFICKENGEIKKDNNCATYILASKYCTQYVIYIISITFLFGQDSFIMGSSVEPYV